MQSRILSLALSACFLLGGAGCSKKPADNATTAANQPQTTAGQAAPDSSSSANPSATDNSQKPSATPARPASSTAAQPAPAQPAAPQVITIPQGTLISVRLGQTITSKHSNSGDQFTATVAEPVAVGDQTVIEAGARATGTVVEAAPLGRFKGGAKLRLSLDAVTVNGKRYALQTSSVNRTQKGKGKRTGTMVGGGAGLGALIGGLAGGGKGAAIGALAGAGAGTAGAAYTGNKDLVIPAETVLSFKILQPVDVQ